MWTWGLGFMAFVMKTWETDPASRLKLSMMIFGFFRYITGLAVLSAVGRYRVHQWAPDLAVWELVGAVQGLAGEYGRSRRRIAAIKARFA